MHSEHIESRLIAIVRSGSELEHFVGVATNTPIICEALGQNTKHSENAMAMLYELRDKIDRLIKQVTEESSDTV